MHRTNTRVLPFIAVAPLVAAVLTAAPGCILVIDHESDSEPVTYSSRRTAQIGVETSGVAPSTASQLAVDSTRTCVISNVLTGSSAEKAGVRRWDIVTHIDGKDWATSNALREAVRSKRAGESVTLTLVREGRAMEVSVPVEER